MEGKSPQEAIHQACLLALPADHDDDVRRAVRRDADRFRPGRRRRIAAAARRRDRRRAVDLAMADALHDAGHLSLSRPLCRAGSAVPTARRAWRRRWPAKPGRRSHQNGKGRSDAMTRNHRRQRGHAETAGFPAGRPHLRLSGPAMCRGCSTGASSARASDRAADHPAPGGGAALHRTPPGGQPGRGGDRLDIEPIALVRMLDKLHEEGLVERRAHPTDRRVRTLWLTPGAEPRGRAHSRHQSERSARRRSPGLPPEPATR